MGFEGSVERQCQPDLEKWVSVLLGKGIFGDKSFWAEENLRRLKNETVEARQKANQRLALWKADI